MRNWKTTIGGMLTLAGLAGKILTHGFDPMADWPLLTAGLGLIAARDHNNHATVQADDMHRRAVDR